MKNKAIFLDRDGVIIEDKGYVHKAEDLKFIEGSIEALKLLSKTDYKLIVITNQAGIGRGYYSKKDYHKFTNIMLRKLSAEKARIDKIYFCPHHPDDNCDCRKPKIKMLKRAERDLSIDFSKSWVIGDKTIDIKMGENAGCKTILVKTGCRGGDDNYKVSPTLITENLIEAAEYILNENK